MDEVHPVLLTTMFYLKSPKTITIIALLCAFYCYNCFATNNIFSNDFFLDLRKSFEEQEQISQAEPKKAIQEPHIEQETSHQELLGKLSEQKVSKTNAFLLALIALFSLTSAFLCYKIFAPILKEGLQKRSIQKKIKALKKQFANSYDNQEFRENLKLLLNLPPGANNSQILQKLIHIDKELYHSLQKHQQKFTNK